MEIELNGERVSLDSKVLDFNEATVHHWIEKSAGWYNHFGEKLALAEYNLQQADAKYDLKYNEYFKNIKESNGYSDKLAEAHTKSDLEVSELKNKVVDAKYVVRLLQQHLRAWDKAHESAMNRSYTLRKEIDKLQRGSYNEDLDARVKDILGDIEDNPNV